MSVQITVIGLGRIGTSIGLALGGKETGVYRVGHDHQIENERAALKQGAIDKANHNLPSAVRDARLVILSLPLSQMPRTLEVIGPELQEGAVVLDTSPVKVEMVNWAAKHLPKARHYVGLIPSINPDKLHELDIGGGAASADLFRKSVFVVDAPMGTPEVAVTIACNFIELLGATPLLSEVQESDGLAATAHLMPQLTAAAILNATVDQPGWEDARKIASRAFAAMTSGLAYHDELDSLRIAALQNRTNVVRVLDMLVSALKAMRDDIEPGDEAGLAERLEAAREGRERWINERLAADWSHATAPREEIPSIAERLFGTAILKPRRGA